MKRILSLIFVFILMFMLFIPIEANAMTYDYTYENVYDHADLLSDSEEYELSQIAYELGTSHNVEVVFLTFDDAEGKSTMVYTDDFYDHIHYNKDGILFAIDMDNREMYINTVGSCINALTDAERESVFNSTQSYVSSGKYFKFFEKSSEYAFNKMVSGGVIDEYGSSNTADERWWLPDMPSIVITIIVMLIVLVVSIGIHNKANKKISATNYVAKDGYRVLDRSERFVRTYETVQHGYYRQSSSSGGGGSSSHRSSGGVRHGGGGRRF